MDLTESLFTNEQNVIDWLADLNQHYIQKEGSAGFGHRATAEHVARLLFFATGRNFEVRQIIPTPTRPSRYK